jgi:hypothetical protein
MDGVNSIREVISRGTIYLQKRNGEPESFDHVDAFVNLCREDETVQEVVLLPAVDPDDDASGIFNIAVGIEIDLNVVGRVGFILLVLHRVLVAVLGSCGLDHKYFV